MEYREIVGPPYRDDLVSMNVCFWHNPDRSPAIVMAYLMKSKGWRLAQGYQWVKERRPSVELSEGMLMICYCFIGEDVVKADWNL